MVRTVGLFSYDPCRSVKDEISCINADQGPICPDLDAGGPETAKAVEVEVTP